MAMTPDVRQLAARRYVALVHYLAEYDGKLYGWRTRIAAKLGISRAYLSRLLEGHLVTVGPRIVSRAAAACGIKESYFTDPVEGDPSPWNYLAVPPQVGARTLALGPPPGVAPALHVPIAVEPDDEPEPADAVPTLRPSLAHDAARRLLRSQAPSPAEAEALAHAVLSDPVYVLATRVLATGDDAARVALASEVARLLLGGEHAD